jgi:hypothetical protein
LRIYVYTGDETQQLHKRRQQLCKRTVCIWKLIVVGKALCKFVDEILCVFKSAVVMGGMCCNFAKAFDFVDPELLL